MSKIYAAIWLMIFGSALISGYKFVRHREKKYRVAFWSCAVILVLMTIFEPSETEYTIEEQTAFASSLRETAFELKKYDEIDAVYFPEIKPVEKLEIKLAVNGLAGEKFLTEIQDETRRIFLHALIENYPVSEISALVSRLKIQVTIMPKLSEVSQMHI